MRWSAGGDSGSHTASRTAPSGGFPCGFKIVGHLGPLHEAGQEVGLGLGLKSYGTHHTHKPINFRGLHSPSHPIEFIK